MKSQSRKNRNPIRRVENLEERVALSFMGPMAGWQGALRGGGGPPAEVQRVEPVSPFQYGRPAPGSGFNQAPGRGFAFPFPGRPNPLANQPPQVNVNPYARFISMRSNPLNNPNVPAQPTTPPTAPTTPPTAPTPPATPTSPPLTSETPSNPPAAPLPPNVAGPLDTLYQDYSEFIVDHPEGTFYPPAEIGVPVSNNQVSVYVNGSGNGDFTTFVNSLKSAGMNINASSAVTWTVSGMLPIAELPAVASNPQTLSVTPQYAPVTYGRMRF